MKFGHVDNPREVDFTIPSDHPDTTRMLKSNASASDELEISVGCAKWNKKDLKNFFPKGVKDELSYYSNQFNSIELNATFYGLFSTETFEKWHSTVPDNFKFFPKLEQTISHFKRLNDVEENVERNLSHMSHLREKLGIPFLQMPDNFGPKHFDRIVSFVENWKHQTQLAIELRHAAWFKDKKVSDQLCELLETHGITNVLVDTAGRRDMMHMRLTSPTAFVRWVGANDHDLDRSRLDEWVERIAQWRASGLQRLAFFVHQHEELESPALAAYFIERLNKRIGTALQIPTIIEKS